MTMIMITIKPIITLTIKYISDSISETENLLKVSEDKTLYGIADITPYRKWDYSSPTLTHDHTHNYNFTPRNNFNSDEPLLASLKQHNHNLTWRLLTGVGLFEKDSNLVLYGGSLTDIIMKRTEYIKDFDFKIINRDGVPDKVNVEYGKKFIANIVKVLKTLNHETEMYAKKAEENGMCFQGPSLFDITKLRTSRIENTITVFIPARSDSKISQKCIVHKSVKLQLTFKEESSLNNLLPHCSPSCTGIALYQGKVYLSALARYSLESVCIFVDRKRIIPKHIGFEMKRVKKYFDKGFDVILPELNLKKIPRRNFRFKIPEVLDFPFLNLYIQKLDNQKVIILKLEEADNSCLEGNEDAGQVLNIAQAIDVDQTLDECIDDDDGLDSYRRDHDTEMMTMGSIAHHNIACVINGCYNSFILAAEGEQVEQIFNSLPIITERMIDKTYATIIKQIESTCNALWSVFSLVAMISQ